MVPLTVDLFTGLHGWARGLADAGFRVIGFDLEDMCAKFGQPRPEGVELVIQDVLTLYGSQFKDANLIVASPPCQEYSYRAMPWKRAKALPPPSNELFDACFRIQREACEAAGRHIPMVVENVCGAQKWVGKAKYHYGSYYLWGDVPALMPFASVRKQEGRNFHFVDGTKVGGITFKDGFNVPTVRKMKAQTASDGTKFGGGWWHDAENNLIRKAPSKSVARQMASAMIARIPYPLARWIGDCYLPR